MAYKFFEKKIKPFDENMLQKLREIIVSKFILVSIVLDKEDNPHLIFESLNWKGRPLSQSDLIRNFFFMRIHVNEQERFYNLLWKPIEQQLGEHLTEFIRHFLMKDGEDVKENDIYFALKRRAENLFENDLINYMDQIKTFAKYYLILLNPETEANHLIKEGLRFFSRMDVTVAYPFLLNVYHQYVEKKFSDAEFIEILAVLENFVMRRFVCGIPTHGLNKIFPNLFKQAQAGTSLISGLKEILRTKNYPKDSEFRERFISTKLYGAGALQSKTKLLLEKIESSFQHQEQADFDGLTIEHVMPQTLTEWWKGHLGADYEPAYELLLHTAGNLTLTGYNPDMSNNEFFRKKEILVQSHLDLNKYFENISQWDADSIRKRSEVLCERALKIWQYFGATEEVCIDSRDDVTGRTPCAILFFGQRISVDSWRDVTQKTLEAIADLDSEKFSEIVNNFPRFVGPDQSRFRTSRQLKNGAYLETHLSAKDQYDFCMQATDLLELSTEEWKVIVS